MRIARPDAGAVRCPRRPVAGAAHNNRTMSTTLARASAPAKQAQTQRQTQQSQKDTARGGKAAGTTAKGGKATTRAPRDGRNAAQQQQQPPARKSGGNQFYFNLTGFPFPLGPFFTRNTVRREIEKGSVWVFEQTQALDFFNVYTPVRMTVIKLASGGLWVHAPVAPTDECIRLLKELDAPVEYIVLPTFAYEHKVFVGPFSRRFPKAKVYVAPYQWSFPLNLPPQFFGIFPAGELTTGDPDVPWADEIEQKLFLPPSIGVGNYVRFSEVAFFHKRSRTLLLTDAVVFVPEDPPEVIPVDALLEIARDNWLARFISGGRSPGEVAAIAQPGPVEDSREARRKGWQRMALLVLYFGPSNLLTPEESFAAISNRLIVGPVVETLVYSKIPKSVVDWVEDICADWNFRQIIPCHFDAPIRAGPSEFRRAFAFAYQQAEAEGLLPPRPPPPPPPKLPLPLPDFLGGLLSAFGGGGAAAAAGGGAAAPLERAVVFPSDDMKTLNSLNDTLLSLGAVKRNADLDERAAEAGTSEEAGAVEGVVVGQEAAVGRGR
ncbi:hypothetical protein PLESTB_000989400 [Pleodorina starrii]|uniref:DUF4336 domain-containing protein n=1 Tax=Pleodorina starrii TaxID=330485 RepID=A0A9W6BNP5_9CHLO|nr:hypothetical protein PLESTM_000552100 [Pleodorina starrii]GLC55459.1 hypothetical protein PLESTB_000989400 [Pleodorina starrii]GLC73851.1 hypothetical protein PLESTF_001427800 [Pleodorina starrii]